MAQGLPVEVWDRELMGDPDRDFILRGVKEGFHIINPDAVIEEAFTKNYKSATGKEHFTQVDAQVKIEIAEGRYVKVNTRPIIISALGAIPKDSGGVRLIHDCSRPAGRAVNDLVDIDSFSFQTVDEALTLVSPGAYMAKVDLKSAYRSIPISLASQQVTGLVWPWEGKDTYLVDKRLPFGAKASPGIFHRITQSVARMMGRMGFANIRVYLDDFIIIENSFDECLNTMNILLDLLRKLGFHINWGKVEGPTQDITFLGIRIDSVNMCIGIPRGKIVQIKNSLSTFCSRVRASKRQLQSLVGKLSWVARVMPAGRIYLRSLMGGIKLLKQPQHKTMLTSEMRLDLQWWGEAMVCLNDTFPIKDNRPVTSLVTDACTMGCGASFEGDWFYSDWDLDWPATSHLHINYKETLSVVLAARRWAPQWRNCKIIVYTDSMAAKGMLLKAKASNSLVTEALKELFLYSIIFNFQLIPVHLPGKENVLADRISRIRDRKAAVELLTVMPLYTGRVLECGVAALGLHMSFQTVTFLFFQASPLITGRVSSNKKWLTSGGKPIRNPLRRRIAPI